MSAAHTPGPWTRPIKTSIAGKGGYVRICDMHYNGPKHDDEAEANARLIAAAPSLYGALARMVREFDCGRTPIASDVSAARDVLATVQS